MELHRVYCSHIQRVPLEPTSLHPNGAYILIDPDLKILGSWTGEYCRNLDRLMAETVAAKIMQNELRKLTTNDCHVMINKVSPEVPPPFYLSAMQTTVNEYVLLKISLFGSSTLVNDSNRLFSVQCLNSDAEMPMVTLVEERHGRLSFSSFFNDKIFILECGDVERYLWVGGRNALEQVKKVKGFVKRTRGPFISIRDGLETILFKEKFSNVADAFGFKSEGQSPQQRKVPPLQAIDTEVRRMVDENFGTLAMLGDPGGPGGDGTRAGLHMSYANDEDGYLSVFVVCVNGHHRALEECFAVPTSPVVLSSSRAYALQYVCKNGSRAFVYLWVSSDCPADVQAALALRCKEIFPAGVVPDQIHIPQGREPPLLLRVVESKRHCPLCIVSHAGDISAIGQFDLCLELSTTNILLPNQSPLALQVPSSELSPLSPHKARILISCAVSANQGTTAVSAKHVAKHVNVNITIGEVCSEDIKRGARAIAAAILDVLRVQQMDSFLSMSKSQNTSRCRVSLLDSPTPGSPLIAVNADRTPVAINIDFTSSCKSLVSESSSGSNITALASNSRPVRLFQVSHSRRSVGAMFVEEIGSGGVFVREDLVSTDGYILDDGRNIIYAWLGAENSYHTMALTTRVVKKLACTIPDTVEMLKHRTDANFKPYEPNQLHFDSYFKMEPNQDLKIIYVRQGEEPEEFTQLFRDWHLPTLSLSHIMRKRNVIFHPDELGDDEAEDRERDVDGNWLSESTPKVKYSDTEEYRRNSIIQQEKRNRKSDTSESFSDVKLRTISTPPLSDSKQWPTPDSAASIASLSSVWASPIRNSGISPQNRRSSTGSDQSPLSTHSTIVSSTPDHFLKVKLKSTSFNHKVNSPSSNQSPIAATSDIASARTSAAGEDVRSITLKARSPLVSGDMQETCRVSDLPAAGSGATDADISVRQNVCDTSPSGGSSALYVAPPLAVADVSSSRRASTGMYTSPKSFLPASSSSKEDFRQVKLKHTTPSKYQLMEQGGGVATSHYIPTGNLGDVMPVSSEQDGKKSSSIESTTTGKATYEAILSTDDDSSNQNQGKKCTVNNKQESESESTNRVPPTKTDISAGCCVMM